VAFKMFIIFITGIDGVRTRIEQLDITPAASKVLVITY